MGKATGRKLKPGKRTKSGQLSRAGILRDKGADRTADKFSVYGSDGSDAIGRAFVAGLLGEDGMNLRNTARSIFRAYWPMYAVGRYKCPISGGVRGGAANDDDDDDGQQKRREDWLNDKLRIVDGMGMDTRRAFDQLCIDINPDEGPDWLERLIANRSEPELPVQWDADALERALAALREIAS